MREQRKARQGVNARKIGAGRADRESFASPLLVGGFWVPFCLVLLVVTAVGVLQSTHRSRQLFAELQNLEKQARRLEENWGRLLLEQSTWASPDRVQRVSEGQLHMQVPEVENMVTVYGQSS
ncbi:cell division protein FtsL [Spongiibacter sp. KMU-158]|uniref:Cell division protein FtsL n=1 Tax=Spongiibacter pelagi TaxID=2760804 RepID=A0A927C3Y9_9GAMM|nr:cell division protein FtsL [Spongiibacter pelagi]MBD2859733.1 cell division protein FtsL [Spongiibacter pelagi]